MEPIEHKVLDKGFVRLIDFMGGDEAVVLAARVSYGRGLRGEEQDRKLINYLLKHDHGTPFEHAVFKFHVKCPIIVTRQWFRHRVSSYNELSGRYTEYADEFYVPEKLRVQAKTNKQASEFAEIPNELELRALYEQTYAHVYENYKKLLAAGLARELARTILPQGLYTQFYWTVNARALLHFINLRADAAAQWEIRQYAEKLALIFKQQMPWTWDAFVNLAWKGNNPLIKPMSEAM
jgi:thymidylate synthase (FAD)